MFLLAAKQKSCSAPNHKFAIGIMVACLRTNPATNVLAQLFFEGSNDFTVETAITRQLT
jgi:hypothetical protein